MGQAWWAWTIRVFFLLLGGYGMYASIQKKRLDWYMFWFVLTMFYLITIILYL